MIRVTVPIDLNAVRTSGSPAFAAATPLRIEDLVRLGIEASLGPRAPQDKRERTARHTLDALRNGRFLVDVDGRIFSDPEAIVVCAGTVTLRFFMQHGVRSPH